ncbi:hypothetical protein [Sphingomonas sp.]|uniref:hypothetical protein n=1 Tax=Sphingomonas sp. TaxID=28214 RepID=UPI0035C7FF57
MIDGADTHYRTVAEALAESAPAGWTQAKVTTEIEADSLSTSEYDYVDADGAEHWFTPAAPKAATIGRALRDLREKSAAAGQAPWSRCTFILSPDGTFKLDLGYPDR